MTYNEALTKYGGRLWDYYENYNDSPATFKSHDDELIELLETISKFYEHYGCSDEDMRWLLSDNDIDEVVDFFDELAENAIPIDVIVMRMEDIGGDFDIEAARNEAINNYRGQINPRDYAREYLGDCLTLDKVTLEAIEPYIDFDSWGEDLLEYCSVYNGHYFEDN